MSKKNTPEQIIKKLRQAKVLMCKGMTAREAARQPEISEQTYYRWREAYGGMRSDQARGFHAVLRSTKVFGKGVWGKNLFLRKVPPKGISCTKSILRCRTRCGAEKGFLSTFVGFSG